MGEPKRNLSYQPAFFYEQRMDCLHDENPNEPCWGQVHVVDIIYIGDGEERPAYACEGHDFDDCRERRYKPEPPWDGES